MRLFVRSLGLVMGDVAFFTTALGQGTRGTDVCRLLAAEPPLCLWGTVASEGAPAGRVAQRPRGRGTGPTPNFRAVFLWARAGYLDKHTEQEFIDKAALEATSAAVTLAQPLPFVVGQPSGLHCRQGPVKMRIGILRPASPPGIGAPVTRGCFEIGGPRFFQRSILPAPQ